MTAPSDPGAAAAGWYPDPASASALRWWDGNEWTAHLHEAPPPTSAGEDEMLKWLLPVGRSGLAIAAGYLGLLSVLLVPAPFALATGIGALVAIRRHPEKSGRGRAIFGIVMGGVFTALLLVVLLSAVLGSSSRP